LPKTETHQAAHQRDAVMIPGGRLLALDLGQKRVGLAVSDERRITVRPLPALRRTNWKQLLRAVAETVKAFDAQALVIGLPLRLDGTEGVAAQGARRLARNFELSLGVPVYLQDERLSSVEAEEELRAAGLAGDDLKERLDGESAAVILRDFIESVRRSSNASPRSQPST
jgi:putative Holliday junction resolvase